MRANRIIKFRAWDEDRQVMITDFSKKTPHLFQNDEGEFFCGSYKRNADWQEPILMQFTGLLDKNGKEIYEGDILSAPHFDNLVIGYSNDKAAFVGSKTNDFSINEIYNFVDDIIISEGWEVIGSTYETNLLTPQTR